MLVYTIVARSDIRFASTGQIGQPPREEALAGLLSDLATPPRTSKFPTRPEYEQFCR